MNAQPAAGAFNPWRGACGFYPPDHVTRLTPVVVAGTRRKLHEGHKLLYTRLVRFWGREGPCHPSVELLAGEMGRSRRQVMRWLQDLEAFGLIAKRRRGRAKGGAGQTNEYVFLWHPIFESAGPVSKCQNAPARPVSKCQNGPFEVTEPNISKCQNGPSLYKEETRTVETHTEKPSSFFTTGGVTDQGGASPTTASSIEGKTKTPNPEPGRWWTPEQFENARTWLDAHRTGYSERRTVIVRDGDGVMVGHMASATVGGAGGRPPDAEITRRILAQFSGYVEFQTWMFGLALPRGGIENYGYYLRDAERNWPSRRSAAGVSSRASEWDEVEDWGEVREARPDAATAAAAIVARRAIEVREEAKRRSEANLAAGPSARWHGDVEPEVSPGPENIGKNAENAPKPKGETRELLAKEAGVLPSAPCCPRCDNQGVRFVNGDFGLVEFCVCTDGERKRREDPAQVENENRRFKRLERLQALAEAAA